MKGEIIKMDLPEGYRAYTVADLDPDLSGLGTIGVSPGRSGAELLGYDRSGACYWIPNTYDDAGSPKEAARYVEQDRARLLAYIREDWYMVGVVLEKCCECCGSWEQVGSLWGIESDSDEGYFAEVARDLLADEAAQAAASL